MLDAPDDQADVVGEPTVVAQPWGGLRGHPIAVLVAIGLIVRLVFAVVSFLVNHHALIPDELQYLDLARVLAAGDAAKSWGLGYGERLLGDTWSFTSPLTVLVWIFGPNRLVGQLFAIGPAVALVVVTYLLARQLANERFAFIAGLLVALWPSQVVWSSVVLRESQVWLALAVVCAGLVLLDGDGDGEGRRPLAGVALVAAGLLVLAKTRDQTLLVTAWIVGGFALLQWRRPPILAALVGLALLVPITAGIGIGGSSLVREVAPVLGTKRTEASFYANSAFQPSAVVDKLPLAAVPNPDDESPIVVDPDGQEHRLETSPDGEVHLVDEGVGATLRAAPRGFIAATVRPFPWEHTESLPASFARFENILWVALYTLAAIGVVVRRRNGPLVWFPVALIGGYLASAAITQGNVGTAFRHRGQILWAFALLASAGMAFVAERLAMRSNPGS